MRTFNFKARNIGREKYLTYTMGEECELDEDVLDYCEENDLKELVGIIYEEDDDYDYLTYDITGRISLDEFIKEEMSCEQVLYILRNVASNLISLKEQAIHLSYVLMNKNFMFVDRENYAISFICLPVESKASVAAEFKGFMRQLLANMRYNIDEDLNYVGKLLTYINSDNFNLRGLVGLSEALMDEAGISHDEAGAIETDGVEVVNAVEEDPEVEKEPKVADFMNELGDQDEPLPEIGDDEEDEPEEEAVAADEELDSILPAGMSMEADEDKAQDEQAVAEEEPVIEAVEEETAADVISSDVTAEKTTQAVEDIQIETVETSEPEKQPEKDITEEAVAESADTQSEEEKEPETETIPDVASVQNKNNAGAKRTSQKKETDEELIKDRIKKLVGDVPSSTGAVQNINSLEELDEYLESKPPVVKKNVVKVNRAAIIQNVAAEQEMEENTQEAKEEPDKVPVIEDIYEDMNVEKEEKEKPKSKSILSKSVTDTAKPNNLLNAPKAVPYLIRVNTEERIMLGKAVFKIGKATRGVDYTVSGNGAISRQHAIITQKDGVCYIRDNKSTNHTYVNGKVLEDGVDEILTHDSMIKLGDEEFLFKIR